MTNKNKKSTEPKIKEETLKAFAIQRSVILENIVPQGDIEKELKDAFLQGNYVFERDGSHFDKIYHLHFNVDGWSMWCTDRFLFISRPVSERTYDIGHIQKVQRPLVSAIYNIMLLDPRHKDYLKNMKSDANYSDAHYKEQTAKRAFEAAKLAAKEINGR
jgi:hypothetical protein